MKQIESKQQLDYVSGFFEMIGILVVSTGIGFLFHHLNFREENTMIVYILGVLVTAVITTSRLWSILSSLLSVLLFNFLFTVPRFSFSAYDSGYPVTFIIAFLAAMLASSLAVKLKEQAEQSAHMAYRSKILLETNQLLQKAQNAEEIIIETAEQLVKLTGKSVVYYRNLNGKLNAPTVCFAEDDEDGASYVMASEKLAAFWAFENKKRAGAGAEMFSNARCMYLTIRNEENVYGVVGIALKGMQLNTFEKNLILSILGECALALEKEKYNRKREEAMTKAKNEQLRANLLRSISHDLRTPLTSISGNAGILLNNGDSFVWEKRKQLYTDIYDDSMWLISLVENLLSVTRLEDGTMNLNLQVELVDEVIEEALKHISRKRTEHTIEFVQSEDILLAKMDSRLIMQVIINMVDNAVKYTQRGSNITICSEKRNNQIEISVSDNGPGIPDEVKEKIFDMFYTTENKVADSRRGLGLGLFLAKSIVQAHGGTLYVKDNMPCGTVFTFTLQAEEVTLNE